MKKIVKAVEPYIYKGGINFKNKPFEAWKALGLPVAKSHYPPRFLHGLVYRLELPKLWESKTEARLRFMQPYSMNFDAFPDYARYEIIPLFWDVWPDVFDDVITWLAKHNIKTAIFTSSQIVDRVKEHFPDMNVMWCPEGIDTETYRAGGDLNTRSIDFFEFGRNIDKVVRYSFHKDMKIVRGQKNGRNTLSSEELLFNLRNAKVVPCYPKNWTDPVNGGNIESLTQRYWECMLSRTLMLGHCPNELVKLIGYNPVVEIDREKSDEQLIDILSNIESYQPLVDKNREVALSHSWEKRIGAVKAFLISKSYLIC